MNWLIPIVVHILEAMFIIGVIGSAAVLVLSAISETKGAVGAEDEEGLSPEAP